MPDESDPLEKLRHVAGLLKRGSEGRPDGGPGQATDPEPAGAPAEQAPDAPADADRAVRSLLADDEPERTYAFDEFIDERVLVSRNLSGTKEMKIKVLEVSDEHPPLRWKFGDRVKIKRILITIKHLESQQIEEAECDIEAVEADLARERHYTSTNRWVPSSDIKNGYVVGSRHISLISDAIALDRIIF